MPGVRAFPYQYPIPDDFDMENGEFTFAIFCYPDSPKWRQLVAGHITSLAMGRMWDRNTGIIKEAQQLAEQIGASLEMTCGEDIKRIADALEVQSAVIKDWYDATYFDLFDIKQWLEDAGLESLVRILEFVEETTQLLDVFPDLPKISLEGLLGMITQMLFNERLLLRHTQGNAMLQALVLSQNGPQAATVIDDLIETLPADDLIRWVTGRADSSIPSITDQIIQLLTGNYVTEKLDEVRNALNGGSLLDFDTEFWTGYHVTGKLDAIRQLMEQLNTATEAGQIDLSPLITAINDKQLDFSGLTERLDAIQTAISNGQIDVAAIITAINNKQLDLSGLIRAVQELDFSCTKEGEKDMTEVIINNYGCGCGCGDGQTTTKTSDDASGAGSNPAPAPAPALELNPGTTPTGFTANDYALYKCEASHYVLAQTVDAFKNLQNAIDQADTITAMVSFLANSPLRYLSQSALAALAGGLIVVKNLVGSVANSIFTDLAVYLQQRRSEIICELFNASGSQDAIDSLSAHALAGYQDVISGSLLSALSGVIQPHAESLIAQVVSTDLVNDLFQQSDISYPGADCSGCPGAPVVDGLCYRLENIALMGGTQPKYLHTDANGLHHWLLEPDYGGTDYVTFIQALPIGSDTPINFYLTSFQFFGTSFGQADLIDPRDGLVYSDPPPQCTDLAQFRAPSAGWTVEVVIDPAQMNDCAGCVPITAGDLGYWLETDGTAETARSQYQATETQVDDHGTHWEGIAVAGSYGQHIQLIADNPWPAIPDQNPTTLRFRVHAEYYLPSASHPGAVFQIQAFQGASKKISSWSHTVNTPEERDVWQTYDQEHQFDVNGEPTAGDPITFSFAWEHEHAYIRNVVVERIATQ